MSRHRLVRNIDIHGSSHLVLAPHLSLTVAPSAELDDAAFDDEADNMTEEQHGSSSPRPLSLPHPCPYAAQMESGIAHIRAVVGDEASSGLDDAIIGDTLWQFYFDIEQSIAWLLGSSPTPQLAPLSYPSQRNRNAELPQESAKVGHHISSPC